MLSIGGTLGVSLNPDSRVRHYDRTVSSLAVRSNPSDKVLDSSVLLGRKRRYSTGVS